MMTLPTDARPVGTRAWVVTGMLCIFMIINFADKAVLGLVAKDAMAELGLNPTQWGQVASSFFALFAISSIVVGIVAKRVSSRWLIAGMIVIWSLAQFPILFGGGMLLLLVTRVILGAGEGPSLSIAIHSVQNWFPTEQRAFPSNIVSMGASLGAVVAAPLISLVIVYWGWRWAFGVLAIAGLVWLIGWMMIGQDGPYSRHGDMASEADSDSAPKVASTTELLHMVPARRVFGSGMWIAAGIAGFACFWGQAFINTWYPQYLGGVLKVAENQIGLIFALPWLVSAVLLAFLGWYGQRLMTRGVSARWAVGGLFGLSLLVGGVALVLVPHLSGTAAIIALTVSGALTVFPMAPTAVSFAVNPRQRAMVLGALVGIASIGGIIAPTVTGRMIQNAGYVVGNPESLPALGVGLGHAFTLSGVIVLVAGVIALAMLKPEDARERFQRRREAELVAERGGSGAISESTHGTSTTSNSA